MEIFRLFISQKEACEFSDQTAESSGPNLDSINHVEKTTSSVWIILEKHLDKFLCWSLHLKPCQQLLTEEFRQLWTGKEWQCLL